MPVLFLTSKKMTLFKNAKQLVSNILAPQDYDDFFEQYVSTKPLAVLGGDHAERAGMLGPDPKQTILKAFERHAAKLTCHAHSPKGPAPKPRTVSEASEYHQLVREYHERDYTVRIPDAGDLSPPLKQFTRALEMLVGNPVSTVVFWSEAGAAAPVHFDNHDIIAIQLSGHKKWYISNDEPALPNDWSRLGEGPPEMHSYTNYDVAPGDMLYLPRGTTHTVQSTSESIHLSIGFTPLTMRDALIAALDHYSDLDKPLRSNAGARADDFGIGKSPTNLDAQIRQKFGEILAACDDPKFIADAMELRESRMIVDRPKLNAPENGHAVSRDSKVRRSDLAIASLSVTPSILDLSQPGDHILIHLGAEPALSFMLENDAFQVSDIPGDVGDDIRIALTTRLIECGFLEIAE